MGNRHRVGRGFLTVLALSTVAHSPLTRGAAPDVAGETKRLEAMAARFAPVEIGADLTALPANERKALARMIDAARVIDGLFLRLMFDRHVTDCAPSTKAGCANASASAPARPLPRGSGAASTRARFPPRR